MNEAGRQHTESAKQHADVVIACLNAIIAYAAWAPVPDLARFGILSGYGLINTFAELVILVLVVLCFLLMTCSPTHNRCSFLLSSPDFRLRACEVFKLVCLR